MDSIVIVAAARTPIGAFNGYFKNVSCVNLGASIVKQMTEKTNVKVDALYMGCVLSAGLGQSAARQVSIKSGLPESISCVNINKICGSGMAAVMLAKNAILAGENEVIIAGGMESMTNAPYLLDKARHGYRFGDGKIIDHMLQDGLLDAYEKCVMGVYAENTVEQYNFTRDEQDAYAKHSFEKARVAIENGSLANEIIPVEINDKKGKIIIDKDEIPFSVDLSKIAQLKPAFKENGTITAASASSIADGAAAVILMKESKATRCGLSPIARIVAQSSHSQTPQQFTTAPIKAVQEVLCKSKWDIEDVDLFEINEAFAVVTMATMKALCIDDEKINIYGGSCALGHPLGASGSRIIVTLLNALKMKKAKKGLATLCVGGGESVAMTFEML